MFSPLQIAQVSFSWVRDIGAEGKNSETFVAHDHQLDADIVIKKVAKADIDHKATYFEESRKLYASSHPNVVQVHYACEDDNHVFVAMPYYQRGSIKGLLAKRHLTVREIVNLGCQIASGLHNIHSKGLIHFDIKVDNILLSDRSEALITDFGLAMAQDEAGRAQPDGIYAPITPPEVLSGNVFDRTYDLYQFGIALYAMCNGHAALVEQLEAFREGGRINGHAFYAAVGLGEFPDRKSFLPHIPARLRKLIATCLEVRPEDRFSSALEVANELAVVDGNLDWQYESIEGRRRWTRNVDGTVLVLEVDGNGQALMTKSVNGSKPKRQTAGCKDKVTEAWISRTLGAA